MTPWRTQPPLGRLIDVALWVLTAVLVVLTLAFSFEFSPPRAEAFPLSDKVGHCVMYFATFSCLLLAGVWRPGRGDGPVQDKGLWLAIALVVAGMLVEVLQEIATSNRHAQLGDVIAEIIGSFTALAINSWARRRWGSPVTPGRRATP